MSTQNRISKALSAVLPGGALGASIILALTSPTTTEARSYATGDPSPPAGISERLRAIRAGVSAISDPAGSSGSAEQESVDSGRFVPAWWGNGGWGRWGFGWHNGGWPNWHNGWHNWGNGGPANNWGNGGPWNNWGNGGWHNYWHNG
jgi:rSAM-associated Gly-rich repeat protein